MIVSAVIGAIPSFWLGRYFGSQANKDLIKALKAQTVELSARSTIIHFERMIRNEKWRRECINDRSVWICEKDVTCQFDCGEPERPFHETWTKPFPNQAISLFRVHLRVQNAVIKSLPFVSADEGRYTLPLPEQIVDKDGNATYYWDSEALESKVAEIIGNFYRYKSLAEVGQFTKVGIHKVRSNA